MRLLLSLQQALTAWLLLTTATRAEDAAAGDDDGNNNNKGDDGMEDYGNNAQYKNGDDYIKYWTDYAIVPKRCIV